MRPKFSIIIPLYNKAPYVRKALESVVSQTYIDWECIIVDDGSTDNSAAICEDFVHSLTPSLVHSIRLIHQPNAGVSAARNNGVAASQGEYVCFLDADDWWEPTFLEEMDKLISAYPDAGLYGCDYFYVKKQKRKIFPKEAEGYIDYCKVYRRSGVMPIHPNGAIIPRMIYVEMGGFNQNVKLGEDFILFVQIVLKYKVAFVNKQLVYFNQDADPKWRAITKLHEPEYHMLWHVSQWVREEQANKSYKQMIDMLRVNGLMDYWLDARYHNLAAEELSKVDWSGQPQSVVRRYQMPIWYLKVHRRFMQIGSFVKHKIIKIK